VYDVVIVGGGPAGLSAALVLGRCRRSVLICDEGRPRNAAAKAAHGFLSRDGIAPHELLRIGREQLRPYEIEIQNAVVETASCKDGGFQICLRGGAELESRKLLIATGVRDQLPEIPGLRELYGSSVHHCPYCDGWEWRDQPVAVLGSTRGAPGLAISLLTWTRDVALLMGGKPLSGAARQRVEKNGVKVYTRKVERLEGKDGMLERVIFRGGESLPRSALFFSTAQTQRSTLPEQLGCAFTKRGAVRTSRREAAGAPGVYVAGDASHDVQFLVVAAAEGAKAAVAINKELEAEDRG
jgi:thioredoxin reductase